MLFPNKVLNFMIKTLFFKIGIKEETKQDEAHTLSLSTMHRPSLIIIIFQTSSAMMTFHTTSLDSCILAHSQDTNLPLPQPSPPHP
jgi:hypothetical protein